MKTANRLALDPNERRLSPRWKGRTLADRFWSHVDKSGDCWLWTGRLNAKGYGTFGIGSQRTAPAHRVAWVIANGREIPAHMLVLHSRGCTSRACVRPDHLRLGDQKENVADTVALGRYRNRQMARGEDAGHAKLTEAQVLEIRRRYAAGERARAIAADFGISRDHVTRLHRMERWHHLSAQSAEAGKGVR